jgi:pyruvate/2-oxoglutarate dehydrogenase complex dihydrolipoamide acyltransferase (E2) component
VSGSSDRFASGAARHLAAELGLDEVALIGSGREGRVTIEDVRKAAPPVPAGLGEEGRHLWVAIRRDWKLRPDEEVVLVAACRTVDELGRLEAAAVEAPATVLGSRGQVRAHPLLGEVRAHRAVLRHLLASLALREAAAAVPGDGFGQARSHAGRQLARQRWSRRRG